MNTPSHPTNTRSLPCFIAEMCKLQNCQKDPGVPDLQPFVDTAYQSLVKLSDCVDQLPDLSGRRWFLQSHYLSACERTYKQLEIANNNLLILCVKSHQQGDPFDILPFTVGFKNFAGQAKKSLVFFQQSYGLEFHLRLPEPPPEAENDTPIDLPFDSFLDNIL